MHDSLLLALAKLMFKRNITMIVHIAEGIVPCWGFRIRTQDVASMKSRASIICRLLCSMHDLDRDCCCILFSRRCERHHEHHVVDHTQSSSTVEISPMFVRKQKESQSKITTSSERICQRQDSNLRSFEPRPERGALTTRPRWLLRLGQISHIRTHWSAIEVEGFLYTSALPCRQLLTSNACTVGLGLEAFTISTILSGKQGEGSHDLARLAALAELGDGNMSQIDDLTASCDQYKVSLMPPSFLELIWCAPQLHQTEIIPRHACRHCMSYKIPKFQGYGVNSAVNQITESNYEDCSTTVCCKILFSNSSCLQSLGCNLEAKVFKNIYDAAASKTCPQPDLASPLNDSTDSPDLLQSRTSTSRWVCRYHRIQLVL